MFEFAHRCISVKAFVLRQIWSLDSTLLKAFCGNTVHHEQMPAAQCFAESGTRVKMFGHTSTQPSVSFRGSLLLSYSRGPLNFIWAMPTPICSMTFLCLHLAANVTVSLPVRGCVEDETCTRDGVTGPGFTLSGSCCQGPRCNSDLRNKTYFSPRIPPLVLLPPPTTPAPPTRAQNSSSTTSTTTSTTTTSTVKSTTVQASHTSPHEIEHDVIQEEGLRLSGGAVGHQDRSNMGKYPEKDEAQIPAKGGSGTLGAWLSAVLLTVVAGTMV